MFDSSPYVLSIKTTISWEGIFITKRGMYCLKKYFKITFLKKQNKTKTFILLLDLL